MTRIKRGSVAIKRRKKVIGLTKGFRGSNSRLFRTANQQAMKALRHSYRDRQNRKRTFRSLWIQRINVASRVYDASYSQFIHRLKKSKIILNRKTLSQLAIFDESSFEQIISSSAAPGVD